MNDRKRILVWPDPDHPHAPDYLRAFYDELRCSGFEPASDTWLSLRALWRLRSELFAVHVHWPEHFWGPREWGVWRRLRRSIHLALVWFVAGRLGVLRVWTYHNEGRHEAADALDRLGYRFIKRHSDLIICHSHATFTRLAQTIPNRRLVLMKMGTRREVPASGRASEEVIAAYGLDPAVPVVGCVGFIRDYKGYDLAIDAVLALGGRVQLIIAGAVLPADESKVVEGIAARTVPWVKVVPGRMDTDTWNSLVDACDLILLPYRKVTGSAALFSAWERGVPVVTSDLPFFLEMLEPFPQAGRCFRSGDARDLARVTLEYLQVPKCERRAAALEAADAHRWDKVIAPVREFFSAALHHRGTTV